MRDKLRQNVNSTIFGLKTVFRQNRLVLMISMEIQPIFETVPFSENLSAFFNKVWLYHHLLNPIYADFGISFANVNYQEKATQKFLPIIRKNVQNNNKCHRQ